MKRIASAAALAALTFASLISSGALAQSGAPAKGSPDHIRAATGKVDGAVIQANARDDARLAELRPGLRGDALQPAQPDQRGQRQGAGPGVVVRPRIHARRGGDAAGGGRHHVRDRLVERRARRRRAHRQAALDLRSRRCRAKPGYKGCCDVVNRGVALYQGKVFVGAYDGRLIALDAATGAVVWEKDTIIDRSRSYTITGAPRVFKGKVIIGNGGAEYGVRGYITAYDAEHRRPEVALVHRARRSDQALRGRVDGAGRQDLGPERQVLGGRRRRHGVGHDDLRSRAQPHVRRHRQRLAVGAQQAQPGGRRQPLPRFHRRAQSRHRQVRLALPGDAGRQLGLHLHAADDPRRPQDRRASRAR